MMIEYNVVGDSYLPIFIQKVDEKLKEGWELYGSMIIDQGFYQPLIRKEKDNSDK